MDSYGLFAAAARTASLPSSASLPTATAASESSPLEREQASTRGSAGAAPGSSGIDRADGAGSGRGLSLLDHQPGYTPTSTHGSAGLGKEELVAGALAAILAGDETLFAAMVLYRDRAIDFSQLARVVCTLALHHALLGAGEGAAGAGGAEATAGAAGAGGAGAGAGSAAAGVEEEQIGEGTAVGAERKAVATEAVGADEEAAINRMMSVADNTGGDAVQHAPEAGIDTHSATGAGQQTRAQQQQQQQRQGATSRTTYAADFATARSSHADSSDDNADAGGNDDEAGAEEEETGAEAENAEAADPSLYADAHVTLLAAMHASGLIEGPDARTLVSDPTLEHLSGVAVPAGERVWLFMGRGRWEYAGATGYPWLL